MHRLTGNHLGTLEVLIRMNVAWRDCKIEADDQQKKIGTRPHALALSFFFFASDCSRRAPGGGSKRSKGSGRRWGQVECEGEQEWGMVE